MPSPDVVDPAHVDVALPPGFSPRSFPIISTHFFGVAPPQLWEPLDVVLARAVGRLPVVVDEPEVEAA